MYKFSPGATSVTIHFKLRNSTTGLSQTGCTPGGVTASYVRQRGSPTAIAVTALGSPTAAYSSGGFIELSSTLSPGEYRLDVPNAALSSGVPFVTVTVQYSGVRDEAALIRLESTTNNTGPGSIAWPVTVNNQTTGLPVPNAEVWVSTDLAGANVIAGTLVTDAFGQVTFMLDAGSYYLWASEPGFTRTNPTAFTVS